MDAAGVRRAVIALDDGEIAIHNESGNRRIAAIAERSKGRFIAACSVSPWQQNDAPILLQKAVEAGARMLVLAPALQGFNLCDELIDPLLTAAAERRLPVYIHTGPHSTGAPTQAALLALRRPEVQLILGHCGTTDFGWDMLPLLKLQLPNIWYELSFVRPRVLPGYAELADPSRFIFASGAPRNDLGFELRQFEQVWPAAQYPQTYGETLQRLLAEVVA
jgi:predicted TIM-barrel fold metal-dependent hydrolase